MTIFIERLQANVTADITDAVRKLQQIKDQAKQAIRDMSGTARIKLEADTTGIDAAKAKMKAEGEDGVKVKLKAEADAASEDVAHAEMQAKADLNPINVKVKASGGGAGGGIGDVASLLGSAGGGLAAVTGLSSAATSDLNITSMAASLSGVSSVAAAATAGIAGLGGALVAALPSAVAMGGAMASLVPVLGAGYLAFSGISTALQTYQTAIQSGTSPTAAMQKATEGLTGAQKQFTTQLLSLEPQLDKLKQQMAAIVLPAASQFLNQLATVGLPVLRTGLTGAATGLASFIKELGTMLSQKSTIDMFQQLNAANTVMIQNWGGAGINIIHSFITTLAAVSPVAITVTQAIEGATGKFDTWISSVSRSGQLASTVSQSFEILRSLLDGVGKALEAVGQVAIIGMPGLKIFADALQGLFDHIQASVGPGAAAISSFFGNVGQFGQQLGGALQSLGPGLAVLVQALGTLASTAVGPALTMLGPALSTLAGALSSTLLPALSILIPMLGQTISTLGTGLSAALRTVTPLLAEIAATIGQNLVNAMNQIAPTLPSLLSAIVGIVNQFSPVIPIIGTLAATLFPALATALDAINTSVGNLMPALTSIITQLGQGLAQVLTTVAPQLPTLATAIDQILAAILPLLPPLATLISQFGVALAQALITILPVVANLLTNLAPLVADVLGFAAAILKIPALGPLTAALTALAIAYALNKTGIDGFITSLTGLPGKLDTLFNKVAAGANILQDFGSNMAAAFKGGNEGGFVSLGTDAEETGGKLSGLSNVASGTGLAMSGLVARTSPATAGLLALGAALPGTDMLVAGLAVNTFAGYLGHFSDSVADAGKSWSDNFINSFSNTSSAVSGVGSTIDTLQTKVNSLSGLIHEASTGPYSDWNKQLQDLPLSMAGMASAMETYGISPTTKLSSAVDQLNSGPLDEWQSQLKELQDKFPGLKQQLDAQNQAVQANYTQIGIANGYTGTAATQFGNLSTQLQNANQNMDDVNNAIDTYLGKALTMSQNTDNVYRSINSFTDGLKTNGVQMAGNTTAALNNRDSLDNVAQSILTMISNLQKQGATSDTIKSKVTDFTNQLYNQAGQVNRGSIPAIQSYISNLGLTPEDVATTLKIEGYDSALSDVTSIQTAINNLPKNTIVTIQVNGTAVATRELNPSFMGPLVSTQTALGKATGGLITNGPMFLVGEGNPSYPEYVIPTDPAHRENAEKLIGQMMSAMSFAQGGILNTGIVQHSGITEHSGIVVPTAIDVQFAGTNLSSQIAGYVTNGINSVITTESQALNSAYQKYLSSLASTGSGAAGGSNAQWQALGQSMAAAMGWTGAEWVALNNVAMRESGWNPTAQNPTSSAYGIAQNIGGPGGYPDPSPAGQISWMLNYIKGRYGDPINAWSHELSAGWYDSGGLLPAGVSLAINNTGRPEMVIPPLSVGAPPSAHARTAPTTLNIENLHMHDQTDVQMLLNQMDFHYQTSAGGDL